MKSILSVIKHIPAEQLLKLDYFKNRGKRFLSRAFIQDAQGEKERIFSDAIKDFHEGSGTSMCTVLESTDPEILEAGFTTFQWLTTNVGHSVLDAALRSMGKKIVDY